MPEELTSFVTVSLQDASINANTPIANNWTAYYSICLFDSATEGEKFLLQVIKCYVNPVISVVGFGANMMSVAILRRGGFRKPSNILLMGLVVADSMTQLQTMNFAEILELFGPDMEYPDLCGWQYGTTVNNFLLVSVILFTFLSTWGLYVNTTIPIVITVERFLAVYTPLAFKKIVTPRATFTGVLLAFLFWLPWSVALLSLYDVQVQLTKVMFLGVHRSRLSDIDAFNVFYFYLFDVLSSWFPVSVVILGCVLIGVKVKVTLVQRKRMTSSSSSRQDNVKWSSRTTRTLLSTCAFFTVTHVMFSCMTYFSVTLVDVQYYIMTEFMNLVLLINASSNFFVYVASDKKLWIIFKSIIRRKR